MSEARSISGRKNVGDHRQAAAATKRGAAFSQSNLDRLLRGMDAKLHRAEKLMSKTERTLARK